MRRCGGKYRKKLFKLTNNLMDRNSDVNLPHFTSDELLVEKFSNFFIRNTTIARYKIVFISQIIFVISP